MKKVFLTLFILSFSITCYCQKEIKIEEAKDNVGDTVKICTKILNAVFEENSKGSPTWLYTTTDNSNAPLTFVIWGEKRKNFDYKPEKDLKEREVCISGKIELLKDKPIMVIDKQNQIDIK
jgi:hypothetical protein